MRRQPATVPLINQKLSATMAIINMPGQGKALDGEAGQKALEEFQTLAKAYPMPHTTQVRAQLREVFVQVYEKAGISCFLCVSS
jgi:hypothetical protein